MMIIKTSIKLAVLILSTALLTTSCVVSNSNESKEIAKVKPEKIAISGDLSDYVQVIENEYEVVDDYGGKLAIKVKALKPMSLDEIEENNFKLTASLLGENGMPVSGTGELEIEYDSKDKLISLLKSGSGEEVINLKSGLGQYDAEKHAAKVKLFTVSSTVKKKEESSFTTSSQSDINKTASSKSTASDGSEDWDEMLDDYDEYVDEYIKFYKKAMKGDNSAMSEYPTIMEKATALQTSMAKAQRKNELSRTQIQRMMKIQTKMTNAALELQN